MPEGHTVHRVALQFAADFVGERVVASSPQGRFAAGAALIDGATMTAARAHGKRLFLRFGGLWLHVHLGLYGAWDFHGRISALGPDAAPVASLGAPRVPRAVRMGEGERVLPDGVGPPFPPEPVGQVRLRLLTAHSLADLRGPSTCDLATPEEVQALLDAAGPDPRTMPDAEAEFVRRLTSRGSPVGQLLMDQTVVAGIGNTYRAEILFRAGLDPHARGRDVPADVAGQLWRDWVGLMEDGVRTGVMVTRAGLGAADRVRALTDRAQRHAVYGRAGEPCLLCGTPVRVEQMAGRALYWCPTCQT